MRKKNIFTVLTTTGPSSSSDASISTSMIPSLVGGELAVRPEERTELGGTAKEFESTRISEESDPGVWVITGEDDGWVRNAFLSRPSFCFSALKFGVLKGVDFVAWAEAFVKKVVRFFCFDGSAGCFGGIWGEQSWSELVSAVVLFTTVRVNLSTQTNKVNMSR